MSYCQNCADLEQRLGRVLAERDEARKKCQELNRRAQEEYSRGVKDCASKRNAGRMIERSVAETAERLVVELGRYIVEARCVAEGALSWLGGEFPDATGALDRFGGAVPAREDLRHLEVNLRFVAVEGKKLLALVAALASRPSEEAPQMSRDEKTVEMTATWLRAKDGSRGVIWWTGENETIHDAGLLLAGGPLETVRGLRERCARLGKALRLVTQMAEPFGKFGLEWAANMQDEAMRAGFEDCVVHLDMSATEWHDRFVDTDEQLTISERDLAEAERQRDGLREALAGYCECVRDGSPPMSRYDCDEFPCRAGRALAAAAAERVPSETPRWKLCIGRLMLHWEAEMDNTDAAAIVHDCGIDDAEVRALGNKFYEEAVRASAGTETTRPEAAPHGDTTGTETTAEPREEGRT